VVEGSKADSRRKAIAQRSAGGGLTAEEVLDVKIGWILIVVVAVVAYLIGSKYPDTGTSALSKVGL
jgi:hypothetical protein